MSDDERDDGSAPWLGPAGQRCERLELHLSYACPNRCRFCSEAHRLERHQSHPVSLAQVTTVLRKHLGRGVRHVHLTGGEPTVHDDFPRVLAIAKKLGLHTSVGTNGVMLAQEDFARRVLPLLDHVMLSLHGPNAAVHEALTRRPGSFGGATDAARHVRELAPALPLAINIVVTQHNVATARQTVALAAELGASLIVVSNVSPEGRGLDEYAGLAVPLAELAELLPTLPDAAPDARLRFFGVPMCILGGGALRTLSNDLHWDPRVTVEWASAPGKIVLDDVYTWTPGRKRVQPALCAGCVQKAVCMGVFDRYLELFPIDVLRPER